MPGRNEYNPITVVRHASWLYPLKGVYYFIRHTHYWRLFSGRLFPLLALSLFIYTVLFTFAYLPQVAFLFLFHGPGAWFNAAVLTLGEGSVLVALLFEAFLVDETLVDVFDAVLVDHGHEDLVERARQVDTSAPNSVLGLGKPSVKSVYSPFSFRQIIEFVLLLPLTFVPYLGVPLFLILTGYRAGPFHHWRYFKLHDFNKVERKNFVKRRQLKYTWFGAVALTLQLVPVLSMVFLMTSAAGSALWAVRLEDERRIRLEGGPNIQSGSLADGGRYADDPD